MNLSREERAAWLERLCDTMSKQMNHAIERGNAPLARVYAIFLARTAFKIDRSLRDVAMVILMFVGLHWVKVSDHNFRVRREYVGHYGDVVGDYYQHRRPA